MLPVVQTFVAFPAGIAKMPRLRFHLYTTVGSLVWYFGLAYAGRRLGEAWNTDPRFHEWFHRFHLSVEIVLGLAFVWFLWTHLNRARESRTV
jgi:membrane protein DedA with SNARE-associated domain